MLWSDGNAYKGFWQEGAQDGIGIMVFKNGAKKAGLFSKNIYKRPIITVEDLDRAKKESGLSKLPKLFDQEIKTYINQVVKEMKIANETTQMQIEKEKQFLGKQLQANEKEDIEPTNQLKNIQDMANAPFAHNKELSKTMYAK